MFQILSRIFNLSVRYRTWKDQESTFKVVYAVMLRNGAEKFCKVRRFV